MTPDSHVWLVVPSGLGLLANRHARALDLTGARVSTVTPKVSPTASHDGTGLVDVISTTDGSGSGPSTPSDVFVYPGVEAEFSMALRRAFPSATISSQAGGRIRPLAESVAQ